MTLHSHFLARNSYHPLSGPERNDFVAPPPGPETDTERTMSKHTPLTAKVAASQATTHLGRCEREQQPGERRADHRGDRLRDTSGWRSPSWHIPGDPWREARYTGLEDRSASSSERQQREDLPQFGLPQEEQQGKRPWHTNRPTSAATISLRAPNLSDNTPPKIRRAANGATCAASA
ncbi:hypothetical protein ACRAWF_07300 [Streptomyces sp. L7]